MGERLLCKQEVVGSIPSGSTSGVCSFAEKTNSRPSVALSGKLCRKAHCVRVISDIVKR